MRHISIALSLLLLLPVVAFAADSAASGKSAEKTNRPNFVVILIDDMGYGDIGPFGSKLNHTPRLDRMAAEGMKLTSFYTAPVCTPSRAQLMTGCYAKRISLPDVLGPVSRIGISSSERTVAQLLKQQGYATICIGKWHLGDQPQFLPTEHGFDHYLGLPYSNDMGGSGKPGAHKPPLPLLRDKRVIEAPVNQNKLVELYTDEAIKFINENKDHPFFVYLPHTAVHVPIHPGKAFQGKSKNGRYGDWVEECDWSTGRILDTLHDLNLESNTLVLFTSDNGPWREKGKDAGIALPLRGGKSSTWEGGMREPTIVRWLDKIAPGTVNDAAMSEMDILPTLVGLAGGTVPNDRPIDGKDIWPLLSGQTKQSPHEALFYFRSNRLEAVRSGPWKLAIAKQIEWGIDKPEKPTGKPFTPILFNLDNDISETTDVAAQHPEIVKRLSGYIHEIDADLGITGRGPGVRPPGVVNHPQPLLIRNAIEYD